MVANDQAMSRGFFVPHQSIKNLRKNQRPLEENHHVKPWLHSPLLAVVYSFYCIAFVSNRSYASPSKPSSSDQFSVRLSELNK